MLQLLQTWRTSYTAPSKMVIGRTVKMIRVRTERHLFVGDFMQRFGWGLGLAVATVLAAIVAAGCFIYLIRAPLEVTYRSPPPPPNPVIQNKEIPAAVVRPRNDEAKTIEAFQKAADAILSRAPNLSASAVVAERPIAGKIPLPRRRPVASP